MKAVQISEFGNKNVFIIKTEEERHIRQRDYIANEYTAPFLFDGNTTQAQLAGKLSSGHEIRATTLTENFSYEDFLKKYAGEALPLFIATKRHKMISYIDNSTPNLKSGSTILYLLPVHTKAEK